MTRLPAVALGMLCVACSSNPRPQSAQPSAAEMPPPKSATVQGSSAGGPAPQTLADLLAGKLSGVTVTPGPSGGIIVRMMGPTSFSADQAPLFVIDGTPVEVLPNGSLPWMNPRDIESITALKNPADIGIYGVRGANGVIVIKTKKAR
jgi:TonB-dependent starch-binding outer membrane protein SusC